MENSPALDESAALDLLNDGEPIQAPAMAVAASPLDESVSPEQGIDPTPQHAFDFSSDHPMDVAGGHTADSSVEHLVDHLAEHATDTAATLAGSFH